MSRSNTGQSRTLPPTLLLSDGGVASLVAAASLAEEAARSGVDSARIHVLSSNLTGIPASSRDPGVAKHASIFSFDLVSASDPDAGPGGPAAIGRSVTLLRACELAIRLACSRVVWPIQTPRRGSSKPDVDVIADVLDRCLLVSRLATLDADPTVGEIRIETPYVDLSDAQMADLAQDLGVPLSACWWTSGDASLTPQGRAEADRWSDLLPMPAGV